METLGGEAIDARQVLTQTHPLATSLGWERFGALIQNYSLPVYGLGGLDHNDLITAQHHGAHGIAMMRGAWR